MLKVGLTGGIGCGKSSAVACFQQLGIPIVDADQIARAVVAPGSNVLQDVVHHFGPGALTPEGALNRVWMRAKVFVDPQARQRLEALLHPVIRQHLVAALEQAAASVAPYVIADVPLLVEQSYQGLFDRVVVVDCLPEQQLQRVQARDGSPEAQIQGIMQAQASRTLRLQVATDVLDNTQTPEQLVLQVQQLHQKFMQSTAH